MQQTTPPKTLYHYCDKNSFISIIKNKKIWATSIKGMNDPNEGLLINEHIKDELIAYGIKDNGERLKIINRVVQAKAKYLITSLSSNGDDLSQWRAYGGSADGYSIGFDYQKLATIAKSIFGKLESVTYEKSASSARVNAIMQKYKAGTNDDAIVEELINESLLAKHNAYKSEIEYRIIIPSDKVAKSIDYRNTAYGLMPYLEIDVADAITEVIIGPKNPSIPQNVSPFLNTHFPKATSHPSIISYR